MPKNLQAALEYVRKVRGFNPQQYLKEKTDQINKFLIDNKLDSLVLGISGGIDSAVVLFILDRAAQRINSQIKQIMPISMPISDTDGVTGQEEAKFAAEVVINAAGYETPYVVDLGDALSSIIFNSCDTDPDNRAWAEGQLASVLRTPVLYYHAAILQGAGFKSLVVGTTNRDEGSYIGFFGKASDAMVDLQIISDLHKSEVYALAKYLKIPEEIINRKPMGDVWDGRCDEEMIGAPYWFLELYLQLKELDMMWIVESFSQEEQAIFNKYSAAIEKLHDKNAHKYHNKDNFLQTKSAATYLNVMNCWLPI